jgi:hypothetical protein
MNSQRNVISVEKNNQINFSYYLGQKVVDININEDTFLLLILTNGQLSVECPWRLRNNREILIGETDCVSAPKDIHEIN